MSPRYAEYRKLRRKILAYVTKEATFGNPVHRRRLLRLSRNWGATVSEFQYTLGRMIAAPDRKARQGQLWDVGDHYYELAVAGVSLNDYIKDPGDLTQWLRSQPVRQV